MGRFLAGAQSMQLATHIMLKIIRKIKDGWSWIKFAWDMLGLLGLVSLAGGSAVTIGGIIWASIIRIPIPIIVMAGFCTLVATVYLAMAPMVYRSLASQKAASARKRPEPPNYQATRHIHKFDLKAASQLWCDIDPNAPSTYDTSAWFGVLKSAIQTGKLKFEKSRRDASIEIEEPDGNTVVTRTALKAFALSIGEDPKFLRDPLKPKS
jgi:hypothetical protein